MVLQLRDYQLNICKKLARVIDNGKRKVLMSAPTGARQDCDIY